MDTRQVHYVKSIKYLYLELSAFYQNFYMDLHLGFLNENTWTWSNVLAKISRTFQVLTLACVMHNTEEQPSFS